MLSDKWTKFECVGGLGCPEVRATVDHVEIRDSQNPEVVVQIAKTSWPQFITDAKAGKFDLE